MQRNLKTGEQATRSTAHVGKMKDARHQGSHGRSTCIVQLTLKRVARRKRTPIIPKVKSGGHVRVYARRTKTIRPNTYVIISHTALCHERNRRRTVVRAVTQKKMKQTREKTKGQHTQDARKEDGESTMLKTRSTARPARKTKNIGVSLRDNKREFRLAC